MADNNQPIPDWLFTYIQNARDLFGIGGVEWSIHAKLSDKPGGSAGNAGWTHTNFKYLNADLEFLNTLEPSKQTFATAVHEIGHVALFEIDSAMDAILMQIPEERREFMEEQYIAAQERYLQRLSRAFAHYFMDLLEGRNDVG